MASIHGQHHPRERVGNAFYRDSAFVDGTTVLKTLRGGANGIEENPEYDGGADIESDSDVDDEDEDSESSDSDSDSDSDHAVDSDADEDSDGDSSSDDEMHETTDGDDDDEVAHSNPKKHHRHSKSHKHNQKNSIKLSNGNKRSIKLFHKSKSNKRSINKRLLKFASRNQLNLYILLAIIAFRRDIYEFAIQYKIIPTRVIDAETGQYKLSIRWSTDILKLILVGAVIYKFFLPPNLRGGGSTMHDNDEKGGKKNNSTESTSPPAKRRPSPSPPLILLLVVLCLLPSLRRSMFFLLPFLLQLLTHSDPNDPDSPMSRLLLLIGRGDDGADMAARMAYLPPLEQHYTFEQLNERYYRDWGAWRKASETNPMVARAAGTNGDATKSDAGASRINGMGGMTSLFSSLIPGMGMSLPPSSHSKATSDDSTKSMKATSTKKYPSEYNNGTVIVLDMTKLDVKASKMESIRDQISFLIHLVQTELAPAQSTANITDAAPGSNVTQASPKAPSSPQKVEVIVLLESPGGGVSQYGLASSHLQRLRTCSPHLTLTICIDEVAASGGYMMACMSTPGQLYCAPFAMVGSIGVIGQSLNVQKTLESYGVKPYVFRGGKMKNPVGLVGEVTKDGVRDMQRSVDRIHDAFREHVASARGEAFTELVERENDLVRKKMEEDAMSKSGYFQLGSVSSETAQSSLSSIEHVMDQVATGDVFLGVEALKLGLVDRLITSDEYIAERIRHGARVLKLINYRRPQVGLSGLFGPPPRRVSLTSIWKGVVVRTASTLVAWAEDGLSSTASETTPSFAAKGDVDGFR